MLENEYRDRLLSKMGYRNYAEYLNSDVWVAIRTATSSNESL